MVAVKTIITINAKNIRYNKPNDRVYENIWEQDNYRTAFSACLRV